MLTLDVPLHDQSPVDLSLSFELQLVQFLLRHFNKEAATVLQADKEGNTPLHYAARNGHEAVVQLLVAAKIDTGAINNHGDDAAEVSSLPSLCRHLPKGSFSS